MESCRTRHSEFRPIQTAVAGGAGVSQVRASVGGRVRRRPRSVTGVGPLDTVASALDNGSSLVEAIAPLQVSDDRATRLLAATLSTLTVHGGPAIPALQRLRHTLVAVVHDRQRAQAEAAQATASAGLLLISPAIFAVIVALLDDGVARLYLFEPIGSYCVLAAVSLSWLGWWWVHRTLAGLESGQS